MAEQLQAIGARAFYQYANEAVWGQLNPASQAYTDLAVGSTPFMTATSAAFPFTQASVGQAISITAGTGWTVQTVVIVSVSGATATFNKVLALTGSTGGTGQSYPNWRKIRLLPGETIDRGQQTYKSTEIRGDRMSNPSVNGSQDPGGDLPWEASPNGWNPFWYHLLGGTVTTSGSLTTIGVAAPAGTPTASVSATGGSLPAGTTYQYEITSLGVVGESGVQGESVVSSPNAAATTTGTTSKITVTWAAATGATGYKIYGRTTASFLYMATVGPNTTSWTDFGTITPAGVVPTSNTTAPVYTHQLYGSVTLPVGFTLEKGFQDVASYYVYYGNRVNKLSLRATINQMVAGAWSLMCRQEADPAQASINTGPQPPEPFEQPFTASQIVVYSQGVADPVSASTVLTVLGTTREVTLDVMNNFYGDRGHILGDILRNNLRPGQRVTTFTGKFQFADANLYNQAVNSIFTKFRLLLSNGTYSIQIDMPSVKLIPTGSTPKATDEGPIEVTIKGEANPGSFLLVDTVTTVTTDIAVTLKVPEASITV